MRFKRAINSQIRQRHAAYDGVTGKYAIPPRHITAVSLSFFLLWWWKNERKYLKIPARLYFCQEGKQPAQREFPLHKQSRRTDRGLRAAWWRYPTMQCRDLYSTGVRGSPWGPMEGSHVQTTACFACRTLLCSCSTSSSPRLLQALAGKFTHRSADTKRKFTYSLVSSSPSFSVLPRSCGLQVLEVGLCATPGW